MLVNAGWRLSVAVGALFVEVCVFATVARAQPVEIEVPSLVLDYGDGDATPEERPIDPNLLVKSAAKRLETVMETASIVTVVTRDDIIARGYRQIVDVLSDVPGFESWRTVYYTGYRIPMARGQGRTILVLWNGVPMNDPASNLHSLELDIPIGTVDRLEIVSGPGGVLWGANAYLGIVNIVTRRAGDELYSAEATMAIGGGTGRQAAVHASASVSDTLFDGRVSAYLNVDVTSSRDAALDMPYDVLFTALPGSNDGTARLNASSGSLSTDRDVCIPVTLALDFGDLSFDFLGNYYCRFRDETDPRGVRTDHFVDEMGTEFDGDSSIRRAESTIATLRWERELTDDIQLLARTYYAGFRFIVTDRMFHSPGQFGPEAVVAETGYDGIRAALNDGTYRGGAAVDVNSHWTHHSLIGGAEVYVEGQRDWVTERAGTSTLTIVERGVLVPAAKRIVFAGFANDKLRLPHGLTFEVGARAQGAAGDEGATYDPLFLPSAALVWRLARDTYAKINYAEGFRPPGLEALIAEDQTATTYVGGNLDLVPERSRAVEAEISAVALRDRGAIERVHVRGGYQFSDLDDLILGRSGTVRNAGRRVLHTAEASANLRIAGGHRFVLAGHFLLGGDNEVGPIRHVANLKLHLAGDWTIARHFRGTAGLMIMGAREDLNRLPLVSDVSGVAFVAPSGSVVVDRTPPLGLLRVGLRAVDLWGRFDASLFVENAFNATPPAPDVDFEKREAIIPQPLPGWSAYVSVVGRL